MSKKITALIAIASLTLSLGVPIKANEPLTVKAAQNQKSQLRLGQQFKFPKTWRGKWFSNNNLTPSPMFIHKTAFNTPWANDYVKVVKTSFVKGTRKYPWQMPNAWKQSNKDELAKYMRVTSKKINGNKWIILSPVQEKSLKNGYAFIVKKESIAGENHKVLFQGNPENGLVINQYFKSKTLTNKYSAYEFKNMKYSKINPR